MSKIKFHPVTGRRQFILRVSALAGGGAVGLYAPHGFGQTASTKPLIVPLAGAASNDAVIWDGISGVSSGHFNYGAGLPWTNKGGDWYDAARTPQGAQGYARMSVSAPGTVSIDVTLLAQRWYASGNTGAFLRASAGAAYIATRRHGTAALRPSLALTFSDGTAAQCACIASAVTNTSTFLGVQGVEVAVQATSHMVLQFALPALAGRTVRRAMMNVSATRTFGRLDCAVMEVRPVKMFESGTPLQGLASNYAKDAGIAADPNVLLATQFADPSWRTLFPGTVAPDAYVAQDPQLGTPAINVKYHVHEFTPFATDHQFNRRALEQGIDGPMEVYFRYYLKLKTGYQCTTDGKKLPGLAGRYGYWNPVGYYNPVDGNGGAPTLGIKAPWPTSPDGYYYSGWSMRHHASPGVDDPGNPYAQSVVVNTYGYHVGQATAYGDLYRWGDPNAGFVTLHPDRWYCIEQYAKMNTVNGPFDSLGNGVGVADGILRAWVDGVQVVEKRDIIYRKHPSIRINEIWLDHYHGGTVPAEAEHPFAMANVVVAKSYIGPMGTTAAGAGTGGGGGGGGGGTGALALVLPAAGMRGPISLNTLAAAAARNAGEQLHLRKVLTAWGSAATSLVKDASGRVTDAIYWIFGGGHGDTGYDGVCCWRASTGRFEVVVPPTKWDVDTTSDAVHGEDVAGRPDSQHAYQNIAALDSDEPNGPALVQLRGSAVGRAAALSGWAHRLDANTKAWSRFGSNAGEPQGMPYLSAFIKDRTRKRFVRYPANNGNAFAMLPYDVATPAWQNLRQRGYRPGWGDVNMPTGIHDPARDLYIVGWATGLYAVPANDPAAPFVKLTEAGTLPPRVPGLGMQYRSAGRSVRDARHLDRAPRRDLRPATTRQQSAAGRVDVEPAYVRRTGEPLRQRRYHR
jgi:hypothetical protein